MYGPFGKGGYAQETDSKTYDEDVLVSVEVAHGNAGANAENGERDGLGLSEVVGIG